MGREILYCNRCGKQLTAEDFTRGRAHTFEHRQYCATCVPAKHDASKAAAPRAAKRAPSSVRLPAQFPSARKPSPLPWILGGAVVAVVIAVGAVILRPAPVAPPPPPPVEPVRKPPPSAPSPDFARDLKELDAKVGERMKSEQYGAVIDVLEEAKKRHAAAEWTKGVAERIDFVRKAADERYPALKAAAVTARAKGDDAQGAALKTRLELWGRKDLAADLDAELAKIVPREPIPAGAAVLLRYPEEGRTYNPLGTQADGALTATPYGSGQMMSGFEIIRPPFEIPEKGELWVTYSTTSEKPLILRIRIVAGDKTLPFNWTIEKPVTGRPMRVKVPLRQFQNYDNKFVAAGEKVHTIYFAQEDPQARLVVFEAHALRLP